jgi:hypothetical protein
MQLHNAKEAGATEILIDLSKPNQIYVRDNGSGMDEEVLELYLTPGGSGTHKEGPSFSRIDIHGPSRYLSGKVR